MPKRLCKIPYMSPKKQPKPRLSLTSLLHAKIVESGLPYIELERRTGVLRQTLMAFIKGEQRGMHFDALEKLLDFFHLEVVERKPAAKRRAKKGDAKGR